MAAPTTSSPNPFPRIRITSVLVAVAAIVFVVLLFTGAGPRERPGESGTRPAGGNSAGGPPQNSAAPRPTPQLATPQEVRVAASTLGRPMYWLGPQTGKNLELTISSTDRVFLRYLPQGRKAGAPSLSYPFVATYGDPQALETVQRAARRKGAVSRRLAGGGLAVQNRPGQEIIKAVAGRLPAAPVFFAYPGSDRIVEVYDPSPARALALVTSGDVTQVR